MWGLEGPLDIQTLHNSENSDLKFRAWPGLLWEAAAKKEAMPVALVESKGVKKAGHSSSSRSPSLSLADLILYSRQPCTWCLHSASGSSVSKLQSSLVQEAERAQHTHLGQENNPSFPGYVAKLVLLATHSKEWIKLKICWPVQPGVRIWERKSAHLLKATRWKIRNKMLKSGSYSKLNLCMIILCLTTPRGCLEDVNGLAFTRRDPRANHRLYTVCYIYSAVKGMPGPVWGMFHLYYSVIRWHKKNLSSFHCTWDNTWAQCRLLPLCTRGWVARTQA